MTNGVIPYHDIEIDKTPDGKYWYLLYWPNDEVVLRLRLVHTSLDDPNDFVAEVKVRKPNDDHGRSGQDFAVVGRFCVSAIDIEPYLDEFPSVWRREFVAMVRHWARLTAVGNFGPALGRASFGFAADTAMH